MRTVTREKLQYYRDTAKDKAIALIPEVQDLMNQYNCRQVDEVKAALAWRFGERFIIEAYEWFDELEEVYQEVQLKEVIILDKVRNTVELFSEKDERCVYQFIKQVNPLKALMETEAYTVLTEEPLTREVQWAMPDYVKTTSQVYRLLLEKFGGIQKTFNKWVNLLEQTAQTRHRGNRTRLEALEAASKLIEKFTAIAPTVPENQLESLLSHPQMMHRILMTLQTQDADLFRSSLPGGSLSLSGRIGMESLVAPGGIHPNTDGQWASSPLILPL